MNTPIHLLHRVWIAMAVIAAWTAPALSTRATSPSPHIESPRRLSLSEAPQRGALVDTGNEDTSIVPAASGARLNCVVHRIEGEATTQGLWLTSSETGSAREPFRVMAAGVGRDCWFPGNAFPGTGTVSIEGKLVRFTRPDLVEEYSVTEDGVRQDFVILERPGGEGELRLSLELSGVRATAKPFGAELTPEKGGQPLAYSRLHVLDANGRQLPARIEVSAAHEITIFVDDTAASYPVRVDPTFSNARLIPVLPASAGEIGGSVAVADSNGRVYFGGDFSSQAGVPARNVACWDGNQWSALGQGVNGLVLAMAIGGGSELYVAGHFTSAGNVSAHGVARWNGQSWSALGGGMNGPVRALAVQGSDVYAAGSFTRADGTPANSVARWNGSTWVPLGPGLSHSFFSASVSTLAVWNGHLYAAGSFRRAGDLSVTNLAQWDGNRWSAMEIPLEANVHTMIASEQGLFVGARLWFPTDPANPSMVLRWDGTQWTELGQGWPDDINALAVTEDGLYAGRSTYYPGVTNALWKWDGATWSGLGTNLQGTVQSLVWAGDRLYISGSFRGLDDDHQPTGGLLRWDGSRVRAMRGGLAEFGRIHDLASWNGQLVLGGDFTLFTPDGETSRSILSFDGTYLHHIGQGVSGTVNVIAGGGSTLFVGGRFHQAGGVAATKLARTDGTSWAPMGVGVGANGEVTALAAAGGNSVYVSGASDSGGIGGTTYGMGVALWNGAWTQIGGGGPTISPYFSGGPFLGLAGGNLYGGGSGHLRNFTGTGTNAIFTPLVGVPKWNGAQWESASATEVRRPFWAAGSEIYYFGGGAIGWGLHARGGVLLGEPIDSGITSVARVGQDLYIAGNFTIAGQAGHVARLDGNQWSILLNFGGYSMFGGNANLTVLEEHGGKLFAAAGGNAWQIVMNREPAGISLDTPSGSHAIPEMEPSNYAPVGFFRVDFPEEDDVHYFGLVDGPGGEDNSKFQVGREGALIASQSFDYETRNAYNIRVRVTDSGGLSREDTFTIRILDVPESVEIVRQPESKTNVVSQPVCFEVEVNGALPRDFQWRRNGLPISELNAPHYGAQTPTLCFPSVQLLDEATYDVVVCNAANCVTSTPVTLKVIAAPVFTNQPVDRRVLEGAVSTGFLAIATGRAPISYGWHKDGQPLTNGPRVVGAGSVQLELRDVQPGDAGIYHVVATNTDGSTSSLPAQLTVVLKPKITRQPVVGSVEVGHPKTISVEATGTPRLTYEWYKGAARLPILADGRISGFDTATLSIRWTQTTDAGDYWVRVCNEAGCTNSLSASLTVLQNLFGPGFLAAPQSRTNLVGTTATFTAGVWGSFPITNQWRRNGVNLGAAIVMPDDSANPLVLTLPNVQSGDAGEYDIKVSNPAGSVTSLPATLTVLIAPQIIQHPGNRSVPLGTTAAFTVVASGSAPLRYEWRKSGATLANGGNVSGVDTATLTIANAQATDAASYDVVVRNDAGFVTSTAAALTIGQPPAITQQPSPVTAPEGATASFSVAASGTAPLTYRWRKGGSPLSNGGRIAGANTATLTLNGVIEADAGNYDAIVSSPFGTNTSAPASLTVQLAPPSAPSGLTAGSPESTRVTLNWTDNSTNETSFRVERSANGVSFSEIDVVGANATSFNDNTVQPGTRYYYRVRAANGAGPSPYSNAAEVTTRTASLTILPATLPVGWILARPDTTFATSQIVTVTGQPFATALRVSTLKKPSNPWEVQLFVATTAAVASNDLLKATFYLRQAQAQPGGEAQAAFLFQRASSPWESSVHHLGAEHLGEWRRYEVLFRARDNYPAGAAQGAFHLGHDTQVIEIGGVTVEHYAHASTIPPSLLPDILPNGWNFHRANAGYALSQIVPVTGQPFTNAIRVTTLQRSEFPHQVQLNMPTVAGVATGNPILATFYLRRAGPSGSANARFVFEQSSSPWTGSANLPFGEAAGNWQRHQVVFNPVTNHGAGQAQVNFQLGLDPQKIEIGGVSVAIIIAPFITAQPVPATTIMGGTAAFSVSAVAAVPLQYQWRKGGVPMSNAGGVSGANSPTLTLTGVVAGDVGSYEVVITNLHGTATSAAVALVLESAPLITAHPLATNATAGDMARFTVTASGTAPLSYFWRKGGVLLANGGNISGANTALLGIANVGLADIGDYAVVVSNKWGAVTSDVAHLSVTIPPSLGVIEVGNPEDGVSLVLNGNPGECSVVLRSPNPSGPWELVATIVYGPDGTASFLDGSPPADQAFYRTEALPSGPPQIQAHPVSVETMLGISLSFTVSVASCSLPRYQWRKNGVNLSDTPRSTGTQKPQLLIADARFSDAGDYDVVVVNGSGSSTSHVAVLTVVGRPAISTQPASVTNAAGTTAALSVAVEGPAPLAYQWRKGGVNLSDDGRVSGSQGAQLSVADAQFNHAGDYDVVVTNAYGAVTSQVAVLTIVSRPGITLQPVSRTNLEGTLATFTVAATGTGPLAFQWRQGGVLLNDGGRIAGAQTVELSVTEVQSGDAGDYAVVVSNPYGSITSQVGVLVVVTRPSIVVQPVSQTNVAGATAHFSVGVAGTAPFGYQWRKGGTNLAESLNLVGAFSPTLAISNLVAADAGEFDVVVTNAYGSITSQIATLSVKAAAPTMNFLEWYRADSSQFDALSDGQAIVNWTPEAGSSATPGIVQDPGHEIVYRRSVTGLNGMPALEFRGGASIITDIANVNFNGVSVFLVFRNIVSGGSGGAVQRALAGQTSNTLFGPWHASAGGAYNPAIHLNGVWKIHPTDVIGWVNPSACVLSVVIDDVSTEKSFINGVEINSTVGPGPMDTTGIGKLSFGHQIERYRGYISEFILYKRVLSAAEIGEVHNYLLGKYGLSQ